ncbi:MAG: aldehyde dehydrogenase family protein [Clostridium sp.]|nr:MAG: aldehyde dehydrogenase family protein [Clostridium sp.]
MLFFGGIEENKILMNAKFDYVFFTGSKKKLVMPYMRLKQKYMTPMTLELGGKSPCIIDRNVNLKLAARRIVFLVSFFEFRTNLCCT